MKKFTLTSALVLLLLFGCSSKSLHISVETAPHYQAEQAYPFVLKVTDNGEPLSDLDIVAILEMARMDHGVIEVSFKEQGNGTYKGDVALPMAGEWIANVLIVNDGKKTEEIITFQVSEE